jgi:hypothetical protein
MCKVTRAISTPPLCPQAEAIKAAQLRLFVRRGGPNYQTGLAAMKAIGSELDIPVEVSPTQPCPRSSGDDLDRV